MTSDLLATKLHRPPIPTQWVDRPYLSQRLNEGLASGRQLTLISAPAGYGKTMCASAWVDALDGWSTGWLSLEPAEDDPARFLTYFLAALQQGDENLSRELAGVIQAGQFPAVEVISTTAINDIQASEKRIILVLDDFHVVRDPIILQFMQLLMANQPRSLHLALLTRADPPLPLARLRANNQMTELRAKDLRFSGGESGRLLNDVWGLSLSPADISALEERTEGWAAGLQLAGLSLRERANPAEFIATLSGGHRIILEYLSEEVLDRQADTVQQFLRQTSILDRLNSELCNAVTGRTDAHEMLERLRNANLFLVPLDDEGLWYRYHHMFRDILRGYQQRSEDKETAVLHQRASHWYEEAGMAAEAIEHALAAQDYALAATLLESHAMDLVMQGHARAVNGWVQAIPAAQASRSPKTDLAFAWMHLLRGAYAQAAPHLERAESALEEPRPEGEKKALEAELLVMNALVLQLKGELVESAALAGRALDMAPEQDEHVRSLAYYALGSARRAAEAYDQAAEAFQLAIAHGRAANNIVAELLGTVGLASMAYERGQLHLAFEIADSAAARVERSPSLPPISGLVYGVLADVLYQWDRLAEARSAAGRAQQLNILGGYNSGLMYCHVLLCRLAQREGNLEDAVHEMQKAVDLARGTLPDYLRQEMAAQQVRLELERNRLDAARLALQSIGLCFGEDDTLPLPADGSALSLEEGLLLNSRLRARLYQARNQGDLSGLAAGIEQADRLIARAEASQSILVLLEALLLRAQMRASRDNGSSPDAVLADYLRALELGEPEGFVAVFVEQGKLVHKVLADLLAEKRLPPAHTDYVEDILSAFSRPAQGPGDGQVGAGAAVGLPEALTAREQEVLNLLAKGLKYRDIAGSLFVSVNTVRYHVKAIYGKLGVHSRTQAVEAARTLRLL